MNIKPIRAWTSDNGDGTFTNPLMWGDYPDNDVIRVGDTFYMMSTSMHLFPGCPVMSSKDLVNWQYESYALPYSELLKVANPGNTLSLQGGEAYGLGPWASALQYSRRLKKFYMLTNVQDGADPEYAVISAADSAKGPWTAYRLADRLYDPGLLFDKDPETGEENGKIYVIHGQGQLYISELVVADEKTGELKLDDREGAVRYRPFYNYTEGRYNEGSRPYKIGDTYHIISTPTWAGTKTKKQIDIQTRDLFAPPETFKVRDIITSFMNFQTNGVHQGALVDVPGQNDEPAQWWSIIFQDHHPQGRVPLLQPVYWEEDEEGYRWPILGVKGKNGEQAAVTMEKPNTKASSPLSVPVESDHFDGETLGLPWQWNHVPDDSKWSLTERPGFLRLYTASVTDDLAMARNTLRQRVTGLESSAVIKLDTGNMADGDIAGLALLQTRPDQIGASICVKRTGEKKVIAVCENNAEQISVPFEGESVVLRAHVPEFEYRVEFSYSLDDGKTFRRLGGRYDYVYGIYVGVGYGIFCYATRALGGYVDVDYFLTDELRRVGNLHRLGEKIEAEQYDGQSYLLNRAEPGREGNPLTALTSSYVHNGELTDTFTEAVDLAVYNMRDGDWLRYNRVDFGNGADWANFFVSGTKDGGTLEIRVDSPEGELAAAAEIPDTGGGEKFVNVFADVKKKPVAGVHRLFLVYRGEKKDSFRISWFMLGAGSRPEIPGVPAVSARRLNGGSCMAVSWSDVPGALEYDIQYTGGEQEKVISNAESGFTETGLCPDQPYSVRVRAKNFAGYSDWSRAVTAE